MNDKDNKKFPPYCMFGDSDDRCSFHITTKVTKFNLEPFYIMDIIFFYCKIFIETEIRIRSIV